MENFCIKSLLLIVLLLTYVSFVFVFERWRQKLVDRVESIFLGIFIIGVSVLVSTILFWYINMANARDLDGRYAASPLKGWFDSLASGKGPCCSDADGTVVQDADWAAVNDSAKPKVHYKVYLEGVWIDVPDDAVLTQPNLYGKTMVWPLRTWGPGNGLDTTIRCFIPGSMI